MKRFILVMASVILLSGIACAEDWHVKAVSDNGRTMQVVFHIPVPAGNNSASPAVSWQTAVSQYIKTQDPVTGSFNTWFSALQGIDAGELASLQAGSLYEVEKVVRFLAADTNLQKKNKIDAAYNATVTEVQSVLQQRLKF